MELDARGLLKLVARGPRWMLGALVRLVARAVRLEGPQYRDLKVFREYQKNY